MSRQARDQPVWRRREGARGKSAFRHGLWDGGGPRDPCLDRLSRVGRLSRAEQTKRASSAADQTALVRKSPQKADEVRPRPVSDPPAPTEGTESGQASAEQGQARGFRYRGPIHLNVDVAGLVPRAIGAGIRRK